MSYDADKQQVGLLLKVMFKEPRKMVGFSLCKHEKRFSNASHMNQKSYCVVTKVGNSLHREKHHRFVILGTLCERTENDLVRTVVGSMFATCFTVNRTLFP